MKASACLLAFALSGLVVSLHASEETGMSLSVQQRYLQGNENMLTSFCQTVSSSVAGLHMPCPVTAVLVLQSTGICTADYVYVMYGS